MFIAGLLVSGVTAFPLETELRAITHFCERLAGMPPGLLGWLHRVLAGLADENARYPFLAYGTDWLAFAHIVLAILFLGPYRHPVRNRWVLQFGFIACAGVLLLAFIAGPIRGIPLFWRCIDASFGVFGALVLLPAWKATRQLEALRTQVPDVAG